MPSSANHSASTEPSLQELRPSNRMEPIVLVHSRPKSTLLNWLKPTAKPPPPPLPQPKQPAAKVRKQQQPRAKGDKENHAEPWSGMFMKPYTPAAASTLLPPSTTLSLGTGVPACSAMVGVSVAAGHLPAMLAANKSTGTRNPFKKDGRHKLMKARPVSTKAVATGMGRSIKSFAAGILSKSEQVSMGGR